MEKHRISSSWRRGGQKHERLETSKERIVRNVNAKVAPELSNESVCHMEITGGKEKKKKKYSSCNEGAVPAHLS